MTSRLLDHLVLPTADLKTARARLTALGFTVAPNAVHPFGTTNACIFLADGTYLEPLAATHRKLLGEAIKASNTFISRFAAYQYRRSESGFSAIAFATDDAHADHESFLAKGWSAGPMLEFSREVTGVSGAKETATFRLAFAADARAPDCTFFTCQRINFPVIDRAALTQHANGVIKIKTIILGAPSPAYFVQYLYAVMGIEPGKMDFTRDHMVSIKVGDIAFDFTDNQAINLNFSQRSSEDQGLQARAVVFGVESYKMTEQYLMSQRIDFFKFRKRIVVHPARGQGTIFAFESLS